MEDAMDHSELEINDTVMLFCKNCGTEREIPLSILPTPNTITKCNKCNTQNKLIHFITGKSYECTNPITENAVKELYNEYLNLQQSLNNVKQKYDFGCPRCNIALNFTLNKNSINKVTTKNYFFEKHICLVVQNCKFCDVKMSIILDRDGDLILIDDEFDDIDHDYKSKIKKLRERYEELSQIQIYSDSTTECNKAERECNSIDKKIDMLMEQHNAFIERYEEKKEIWQEKVIKKYGDIGPFNG
jgi:hypothetical protein